MNPRQKFDTTLSRYIAEARQAFPIQVDEDNLRRAATRLQMAITQAARSNPKIIQAAVDSPTSMGFACLECALVDLYPGGPKPDVYLIPRMKSVKQGAKWVKVQDLNWQISARGLKKLAERAGWRLHAVPVFKGEAFDYARKWDSDRSALMTIFHHTPSGDVVRDFDHLIGVYVAFTEVGTGYSGVRMMYRGDPNAEHVGDDTIAKRMLASDAYVNAARDLKSGEDWQQRKAADSPWMKWPIEMAMKTAIIYTISRGDVAISETASIVLDREGKRDAIVFDTVETQVTDPKTAIAGLLDDAGAELLGDDFAADMSDYAEGHAPEPVPAGQVDGEAIDRLEQMLGADYGPGDFAKMRADAGMPTARIWTDGSLEAQGAYLRLLQDEAARLYPE